MWINILTCFELFNQTVFPSSLKDINPRSDYDHDSAAVGISALVL